MSGQSPRAIRQQLKHPVVDCDGHWLESHAMLAEYISEMASPALADKYVKSREIEVKPKWYSVSDQERMTQRIRRRAWWHYPYDAKEQATFRLPKFFAERMEEMGIDFAVVYPTAGLSIEGLRDPELRAATVRAYNTMTMDLFRPYADKMTPVAVIPRRTPKEAVDELNHAVRELGFKAIMISGTLVRRSPSGERYVDALGIDNAESYDPVWKACMDLGVAVTSHAGSLSWVDHASVTNYVYNHVGHFAQANHAFCKAVFLGGVTKRFPKLNFGFLEGGTGWARNLYSDLLGHFDKRSAGAVAPLKPTNLDTNELRKYIDQYGNERMKAIKDKIIAGIDGWERGTLQAQVDREREHIDDFAACGVTSKAELRKLFSTNFFFGCEADDPMTTVAFDKRLGHPLNAVFSSDIAHWDVPDVLEVLPEAYEMLEHNLLNEEDFKRFTFTNAVRLHGEMNPNFFKGTAIEAAAKAELQTDRRKAA
jgi:predicted TIM-barrel fold metal-dependent hydrolase